MPKHHNPAHHKKMAQAAKKRGDMAGYMEHMKEAKQAGKKK